MATAHRPPVTSNIIRLITNTASKKNKTTNPHNIHIGIIIRIPTTNRKVHSQAVPSFRNLPLWAIGP